MNQAIKTNTDILSCCLELFSVRGIRSVSIEDIVRSCNLSKKELYEHFGNKEGIVRSVLEYDCQIGTEEFSIAQRETEHAIDEMMHVCQFFKNRLMNKNPILFYDLAKYYGEIYETVANKKREAAKRFIVDNLEKGIEQGLYRKNIPIDIISKLWLSKIQLLRAQKEFPARDYPISNMIQVFTELHLRSIATDQGAQMIHKLFKTEE